MAEDDYDIWTYDIWTYDIEGSKASGELIVELESDFNSDSEVIIAAKLRLSTGEEIELTIE